MKLILNLTISLAFAVPAFADEPVATAVAPKVAFQETQDELRLITDKNVVYSIPLKPSDPSLQQIYNEMPDEMKVEFQQKRRDILKSLIQSLRFTKFGLGMGSVIGDKITWVKEALIRPFQMREMKNFEGPMEWFTETDSTEYEPKEKAPKQKISERGNQAINAMLVGMDKSLWERAPLIAHSNEYGIVIAAGSMAEAGVRGKGGFGGQYSLGVALAVNKDSKAAVFQIFQSVENFKSTILPFAAYLGFNVRLGVYIAEQSPGREHLRTKGTSDYPIAVPVFKSDSPSSFSTGMSAGLFPPPPFDSLLTFKNHNSETVMLRVSVSPMLKGFMNFKTGIGGESLALRPVNDFYQKIRISVNGNRLCSGVHLN